MDILRVVAIILSCWRTSRVGNLKMYFVSSEFNVIILFSFVDITMTQYDKNVKYNMTINNTKIGKS